MWFILSFSRSSLGSPPAPVNVQVSSGSFPPTPHPHLLHPSLSLCFPTVIDSSLQSLTVAHQHLLRSEETERVACVSKSVRGVGSKRIDCRGGGGGHDRSGLEEVRHQDCCGFFSDSQIYFSCEAPVCCRFMVRGLGEHLIMQLTWVPRVCCYGDCQGSLSIIGVYPRQEQGYPLSIRTRFNLPHSFGPHIKISTFTEGQRGRTQRGAAAPGVDAIQR